jgi:hypothetical protein
MPWKSLAPFRFAREEALNHVSVQLRDIQFRIDGWLLTQLGWRVGDRVDVMPGSGEHTGMVRIERNDKGWKLLAPGGKPGTSGGTVKITKSLAGDSFGAMPDRLRPHMVAVTLVDGGLELTLPWAQREEPAAGPKRAKAEKKAKTAEPGAPEAAAKAPAPEPVPEPVPELAAPGPRVETVEEALARGVAITVAPPAMPGTSGNPVRTKAHPYAGGRVHG